MDINSMSYHVQKAVSREENIQTELLVIFLVEGRMTLKYQDESYQMKAEDIILINPGVSYEIEGTRDALYGIAAFSMHLLTAVLQSRYMIFYCNSVVDDGHSYQDLRDIFFQMTAEYTLKAHQTNCYLDSLMF